TEPGPAADNPVKTVRTTVSIKAIRRRAAMDAASFPAMSWFEDRPELSGTACDSYSAGSGGGGLQEHQGQLQELALTDLRPIFDRRFTLAWRPSPWRSRTGRPLSASWSGRRRGRPRAGRPTARPGFHGRRS